MTECIECAGNLTIGTQPMLGEIISCCDCGTKMEVRSVTPLKLESAPQVDEDWGE
ncbi:lysine biosynthesis protein LysW [Candidatus Parvarchaeota archaeon]|nr:lysine biosynthesis protein LysW [Candidatus Parvarchaeota archaeon]